MHKSLLFAVGATLIFAVNGAALAQSTNDAAAPAMSGATGAAPATQKLPNGAGTDPATSADKPAQPGGASGTGAAAKSETGTSK